MNDLSKLMIKVRDGGSSLVLSKARSSLIARGRRDLAELATRISTPETAQDSTLRGVCNKCGECKELVLSDCVCFSCKDSLDNQWAGITSLDWVLVTSEAQFSSFGRPAKPDLLRRYVYRNTTYRQMKLRWAICESPRHLFALPATPEDLAQMKLVCVRSKRPDSPTSDEDIARGPFAGWPRSRLAFIRPANGADIAAQNQCQHEKEQHFAEKFEGCYAAAQRGNAWDQCKLGYMYFTGEGVAQDYAEAVQWLRRATEQGDEIAQCDLGLMYYHGHGVALDFAEAARCYRKAAEKGISTAQFNLGQMYDDGQGVPPDLVESHMWLTLAASDGSSSVEQQRCAYRRESVARKMTAEQIAEAQRRARDWKPAAVNRRW